MSRAMYRYQVSLDGPVEIALTGNPVAFAAPRARDGMEFWAEHDDSRPVVQRTFMIVGTGHPLLDLETGTRPHAYEPGAGEYGSGCARCGRVKGRDVHAAPCPSVSPDGDACTVAEPGHEWHYGPDEGGGVRRMWDDADAAAAIASGQPATASAGECGGTWRSATDATWYCTRDAGHDGRHRAMAGDDLCAEWDDANGTEYAPAAAPETEDAQ